MRRSILSAVLMLVFLMGVLVQPALSRQFTLFDKPLNVFGFASQFLPW